MMVPCRADVCTIPMLLPVNPAQHKILLYFPPTTAAPLLTCRKHEAPRHKAEVPGPVHLAHAVHVSRQSVLPGALVRPGETVDALAALQVAEYVGPVAKRKGEGREQQPCVRIGTPGAIGTERLRSGERAKINPSHLPRLERINVLPMHCPHSLVRKKPKGISPSNANTAVLGLLRTGPSNISPSFLCAQSLKKLGR